MASATDPQVADIARANAFVHFDTSRVPSPCFVVDVAAVEANLQILARVQRDSGAKILAALKAFSLWRLAPLIARHLSGICASGLHEATLGHEEYGGEVHVFGAAYSDQDFKELLKYADHIDFNSFAQWRHFKALAMKHGGKISFGIRINPEHSEGTVPIYDP